jgi:hypothetical protein
MESGEGARVTLVGELGLSRIVIEAEGDESGDGPTALVAVTVKVYEVPASSSEMTHVVVAEVHVRAPGVEVAV